MKTNPSIYDKREVRNAYLFLAPVLIIVGIFILFPVIGTFYTSLFRDTSYLAKKFVGLKNYINILEKPDFWNAMLFTLAFTFATVVLEIVFGLMFALLLNESFPGRGVLRTLILIPWAIPTIISAVTWKLIYQYSYGILNYIIVSLGLSPEKINWFGTTFTAFWSLVIADVWKTTPFVVIILLAGLQAIPRNIYKQAKVDGARLLKRFVKITLPLLKPVLVIAIIFRTIDAIRIFDLVYVLTGGGPGGSTQTLSFLGFNYFSGDNFGMGSAISILTFLVSFAITLVYIKAGNFQESLK